MAVARINAAISRLDMREVREYLESPARDEHDPGFVVRAASKDDWIRFVKSDNQALMSRTMHWKDGTIYVVELPGEIHETGQETFKHLMILGTGTGSRHLRSRGSTFVKIAPHLEPDASFGPRRSVGVAPPPGLNPAEFHTLKVEVGVSRGWPILNAKARAWSLFDGVEYVLCLRFSPKMRVCQFRLFSVVNRAIQQPEMPIADIVRGSFVAFDSRRLLGLPPHAPLPAGFADPHVIVNLFPIVATIHEEVPLL